MFTTVSGRPVRAVYGPEDGLFPGDYPFTRGVHASMYRSRLWTMRMFAGFGTPTDTNERFKAILAATALEDGVVRPGDRFYGEQGVIDLLAVAGYYGLLALVMNVARTPVPEGPALPLPGLPVRTT